jgi:ABC-type antimicrobial peptide transport system permease subunit
MLNREAKKGSAALLILALVEERPRHGYELGKLIEQRAVSTFRTLGEVVAGDTSRRRFQTLLVALFASVGLAMVLGGVHGLLSWQVAQRTREFGIRMALGADAGRLVRAVMKRGLVLAGLGSIVGCVLAIGGSRVVESLLFGVSARNPVSLIAVAVLMASVGVVGAAVPAWRASRVDPAITLRAE